MDPSHFVDYLIPRDNLVGKFGHSLKSRIQIRALLLPESSEERAGLSQLELRKSSSEN